MLVYIFYFLFLILGALVLGRYKANGFMMLAMFFLCTIIGLRSEDVGIDTRGYINEFQRLSILNFKQLLGIIKENKEPLYVLVSWLIGQISSSSIVYTMFWAFLPCFALYIFLKDEIICVKEFLISILCFFSLGFFAFFVAGIRQTAAISVVLVAYHYLVRQEVKWSFSFFRSSHFLMFCFFMYIAYNLHNSSILFLLVLPILKIRVGWWYCPFVISLFFIGHIVNINNLVEISSFFFDDRFANYGTVYESSQSLSAFLMQLIFFSVCYFKRNILINSEYENKYLFNIILLGLIFQSFSGMIYEMARVAFYFSIFLLALVPKAIEEYSERVKLLLYIGMTLSLLIYLFFLSGSNLPYYKSALF